MAASNEIIVLSNDVVPHMGTPSAAPGLRAWGIAQGLRSLGHPVTVVVDSRAASRAWSQPTPQPRPRDTLIMSSQLAGDLIRTRRPRAVILINSNQFDHIGDIDSVPLIFDFFAPKMLELAEALSGPELAAAGERLRRRKLAAFARCDGVVVNGVKKVPYVEDWLRQAGRRVAEVPLAQVATPIALSASRVRGSGEGPLNLVVSGYLQPWSRPGAWVKGVRPFVDDGSVVLHLMIARHWGGDRWDEPSDEIAELAALPSVKSYGRMEFEDFRRVIAQCDLAIDVFERSPERELAMVTRTLVSLACGIPTIHVPFTETGLLVKRFNAGWLVDGDNAADVEAAVRSAASEPSALERRRRGATRLGRKVLDPVVAVAPLHDLIEGLA